MTRSLKTIIISLVFLLSQLAFSVAADTKPLTIPYLEGAITLDGVLNEPQWQQAAVEKLEYVTEPNENMTLPVETTVYSYEDGETLYIAFIALDPEPEKIRALYRDRDFIFGNDLVGVKIDTFNDRRLAYQFFVNPFGVQADLIENEMTKNENDAWNAIWESAGQITDEGYIVEMALPLRIMNFPEGERTKVWGAEFIRFYPRQDDFRLANVPYDRNNACILCQLGEVDGFEKATQGQNLAIVPTVVAGKSRYRDIEETRDWTYEDNQEVGLDINWGITPEVTLQATLNPDFSQVEADVAQLSINNTFALFFSEQRPFFTENADYFSSNLNLIYTRNVNAPDFGSKITGRIDEHSIGVFVANDDSTTFLVPGNLNSSVAELEEKSSNAAIRYRYDYSDALSLGVVSTLRKAGDYHNYVNGLDVRYLISDKDTLRAQVVVSDTQYPTELFRDFCDNDCDQQEDFSELALRASNPEAFSGINYRINYRHQERDWDFRADHYANGEDFRADLGFVSRVDRNTSVIGGGYNWWNDNSWWNRIRVHGDWDISHNDAGELIEKEAEIHFSVRGDYQTYLQISRVHRERVGLRKDASVLRIDGNTDLFAEQQWRLYLEAYPNEILNFNVFASYGDQVDFDNNRLGDRLFIEGEVELNLGRHLYLGAYSLYSDLEFNNQQVFTARIIDTRMTYQFDARQFLRLIVSSASIDRNLANYNDDIRATLDSEEDDIGVQLLYSYKINPLTKFFVGISDGSFRNDRISNFTSAEQSVFMKFSYAWLQ